MASSDPDFENKAADIIAPYQQPPQHAAVFCVDRSCHWAQEGPSGMASNTTVMERCHSMLLSIRRQESPR
jgi:hypothetical protein